MDYRPLGRSGLLVSSVGLGCNNFGGRIDLDASRAVVQRALDEGVTFFDTADIYGGQGRSEEFLGILLEGHRDEVVLATKFGHSDVDLGYGLAAGAKGGRAHVRRAVEASLRRLRTDHIDLYQPHTPDPVTPIAETLTALAEKFGRSLLDLAIGGLAAHPATGSVIAGATKPDQVSANVKAGSWTPTADELAAINEVVPPPLG